MQEPTCSNCAHFRRHYIRFHEFRFTEVPCGHCVHPRLKHRRPDTPACVHFQQKETAGDHPDGFDFRTSL